VETVRTLVDALGRWADRLMPDPDRARRLQQDLAQLIAGDGLDEATPLTPEVVSTVEAIGHRTARHLTLQLHPEPGRPDAEPPGWPAVSAAEVAGRAGNVRSVQRDGRIGELRLDGFDEVTTAGPYLQAAFTLLRDCDAVVLDLRSNGGGALSSLALVAEFVLGSTPTQLATVDYRDRPARQWWTAGTLGDTTLAADARVAVLIGPGTYSSGEALAYHLVHRRRVRTFGQRTPGAADHVTPVRVTPSVTALMPEGTPVDPVTGGNWEGAGVSPAVPCEPAQASSIAHEWLRSTSRTPDA
jgi:C-terminal processing protease CtpA/Prc